jgi:hypothetical protein
MAKVSSEYWAYNDPRWSPEDNIGKYSGPWEQVLKAMGFQGGPIDSITASMTNDRSGVYKAIGDDENGYQLAYSPEAKAAIDNLRASGYDLRWKHPDRRTFNTYWGFVTPDGVQDIKIEGSDLGDMIKPLINIWGAGLGLAGLGAGINSLLSGAGAGAGAGAVNALAGGGIGGTSGAAFADIAGGLLPEFGTSAAYSAGLQGLPAVGGVLSAADLASLPSDVLGQISPTERVPLPMESPTVTPLADFPPKLGPLTAPSRFEFGTLADPAAVVGSMPSPVGVANVAPVGGGIGGTSGAAFADIAGGLLPEFGTSAAYSAGLQGLPAVGGVLGAGAGATGGVAGGGGVAAPTATATTAPAVADIVATGATGAATGAGAAGGGGDFLSGMSDVAATEGAGVAGTGILTSGTNIPSTVLSGGSLLDKAVQLVTSPVGQAVVGGVGSVVGGVLEANAAEEAAETQSQAAANALALQREMFEYQKGLLEPYRTAGTKALERLSGAMGLGGPGSQQQMLEMDPGYGFRLGEGLKALERMQASRGNFLSGGALKAGQRFAQDTASQEYGNAYNRLANIAGLGQTAGTQMGGAAAGFGTSAGNIMGQEANALAAGRLGRTSAYTGAIGGALGSFENYLNRQQRQQMIDIYGRMLAGGG